MFELLRTFGHDLAPFVQWNDVVRPRAPFASTASPHPADVVETADAVQLVMDLPGYAADAISVNFENDLLSIQAERNPDEVAAGAVTLLSERGFGKVRRAFSVNVPVDADGIAASYDRGVLTVKLPKRAEAKPRKIKIAVK